MNFQKLVSDFRKPLQESSKQNIVTPPMESANPLKGFNSVMQIEQVSNNHFKFTEENIPPDNMEDPMEGMEDARIINNNKTVVLMQEDANMCVETPTHSSIG